MHDGHIVDLFAGPGGLDVAADWLGIGAVGVELDEEACATRVAAGLATRPGDVKGFRPSDFPAATVLTGGPPCQTYTVAGGTAGGAGRRALAQVLALAELLAKGRESKVDKELAKLAEAPGDLGRSGLVLEPLRWALTAMKQGNPYEAIVLEQVTTVRPVWEAFAKILERSGYTTATGVLHAEEYGVPQTRKRAVLIARLRGTGPAMLPEPTHRSFRRKPRPAEPPKLPCVTMGDLLDLQQPYEVISNYGTGGDPRARGRRRHDEPAFTVTSKIRRNKVVPPGSEGPDVRFSFAQAGQLQSFPRDFPWRGADPSQQIGNAVPPLLGVHLLAAALYLGDEARDAAVKNAIECQAAAPQAAPSPGEEQSRPPASQGMIPFQEAITVGTGRKRRSAASVGVAKR
ncbi:DNA cytosine methyltransferase [Streptomyces sp. NPDC047097]|uniref:DNA cytosine methyltransferase n=1 Tax=Streptomyces sp. NPDC047097 TaxID=3155260 RepID=UPI0033C48B75